MKDNWNLDKVNELFNRYKKLTNINYINNWEDFQKTTEDYNFLDDAFALQMANELNKQMPQITKIAKYILILNDTRFTNGGTK